MANANLIKDVVNELHCNIDYHLRAWLPEGKKQGHEWIAKNPTRNDSKPGSFCINMRTGKWSDFATGDKGGDLLSLYAYLNNLENYKAALEIKGGDIKFDYVKRNDFSKKKTKFIEESFIPLPIPEGKDMPPVTGNPELNTIYCDYDGSPLMRVTTYRDERTGKKSPVPCCYGRRIWEKEEKDPKTGKKIGTGQALDKTGWHYKHMPDNRPLCGLPGIKNNPEAVVLVVEGEKTWHRMDAWTKESKCSDKFTVVTWAGGSQVPQKTDWSPLEGRKVIICPDYDAAGAKAAMTIAVELKKFGCPVKIAYEDIHKEYHPKGWDLADEPDGAKIVEYLKDRPRLYEDLQNIIASDLKKTDGSTDLGAYGTAGGNVDKAKLDALKGQKDLRCLGYSNDNKCYFICKKRGVIVALTPAQMCMMPELMSLMDSDFWYALFGDNKGGLDKYACGDTLQRWADDIGYFNADMIRGSGVWREENGDVIFHLGQRLLVNNQEINVYDYDSDYMYEAKSDLGIKPSAPLKVEDAFKLVDICKWLKWDSPVFADLLAGYCVVAPLCGGLEWRPHIWVTGSAGSGKTTVIKDILRRICGKVCLFVQGDSSAAGIRQRLGSDALPVIFDEFEGETPARLLELTKTLDLARQASSETGAMMLKGGAGGDAVEFKIRSSFAFSAINVNIQHYADSSRISVLTLTDPPKGLDDEEKKKRITAYNQFKKSLNDLLTNDYISAFQMRNFRMLPIIQENARLFTEAVARHLDNRRIGDQLGILCAGRYALESDELITPEFAEDWVLSRDWTLSAPNDDEKDHDKCLSYITQATVKVPIGHTSAESTIGELIARVVNATVASDEKEADEVLKRHGIKVRKSPEKDVCIAQSHTHLANILRNTPYNSWHRLLLRLDGAKQCDKPVRFSAATVARAVSIPIDTILKGKEQNKPELAF